MIALTACATREPRAEMRLHGPLAALVEHAPVSLARCSAVHTQFSPPFWRAPYASCIDSLQDGQQGFEVDSDSVVVSEWRDWTVPAGKQDSVWARVAGRIESRFDTRIRGQRRLSDFGSRPGTEKLGGYCALWRGPDSVEVSLFLQPITDVGPADSASSWKVRRYARYGPLAGAVACGARS